MSEDQIVSAVFTAAFAIPAVASLAVIVWLVVLYLRHSRKPDPHDRVSGYAVASVIASLAGIPTVGIVFGHLAILQTSRNPCLRGRRIARWGLIVGYSSFIVIPAYFLAMMIVLGLPHGSPIWVHH
jgi:hypothetical protein